MGKRIYIPSRGPDDWQRLLANPVKHWKPGYSAQALAECWEAANGWPTEVAALLKSSAVPAFDRLELLLAIPEYKVDLPPRGHPSQNDLFVLAKAADGQLVTVIVEGKVGESFGPMVEAWRQGGSAGKIERLAFLIRELGLSRELPPGVRYQLLHRTVSTMLLARQFNARYAVMLVHSFSPINAWFEDFRAFVELFGVQDIHPGMLYGLREIDGIGLYAGWASGDSRFKEEVRMLQTTNLDLFAGISVADYAAALAWYERLLGSPPTFFPNDIEAVWELAEHRFVYIEHRPEHAGHALHTFFVNDLDTLVARIADRGLDPVERETYSNGVRKITYRDPDGNEIGLGGAPLESASG